MREVMEKLEKRVEEEWREHRERSEGKERRKINREWEEDGWEMIKLTREEMGGEEDLSCGNDECLKRG